MTVGGVYASLAAFGVAALTMVSMIFLLAILIGTAQGAITTRLRAEAPQIKRWGGAVLIVAGLWLAVIGVWANFFATLFPV